MKARHVLAVITVLAGLQPALVWSILAEHLEKHCDGVVILPCPADHADVYSRTGTLSFFMFPKKNCQVFVGFAYGCQKITALYFNIRESIMPSTANITIYEISDKHGITPKWNTVKRLGYSGDFFPVRPLYPESVGQLLSSFDSYRTVPVFDIELKTSGSWSAEYEVIFDYTIVLQSGSYDDIYCSALGGYVPNECGYNGDYNRLICPSNYHSTVFLNPAYGRQTCATGEDTHVLVVAIVGTLGGVFFLVAIISLILKNSRRKKLQRAVLESHHTVPPPVIVGSPYPPMHQQGLYLYDGQPPPYPAEYPAQDYATPPSSSQDNPAYMPSSTVVPPPKS